jgi:hypothetical protein
VGPGNQLLVQQLASHAATTATLVGTKMKTTMGDFDINLSAVRMAEMHRWAR